MTLHPVPKPKKVAKARKPLRAKKPMKRFNAKRGGHKFPKYVDAARREFVRSFPCAPCLNAGREQWTPTQACHLKSRGAGGRDAENLWPGCEFCHTRQHVLGVTTFERTERINLRRICGRVEADFVRRGGVVSAPFPQQQEMR